MKILGNFRSSLLMSAIALSVLSSTANAVSEDIVKVYWRENIRWAIPHISFIHYFSRFNETQWEQFLATATALFTEVEYGYDREQMIAQLTHLPLDTLFHEKFITIATTLLTKVRYGGDRAKIILALSRVPSAILFHEKFLATATALFPKNMTGCGYDEIISTLGSVPSTILFHERFIAITTALITKEMPVVNHPYLIAELARVALNQLDRVYGQIQRLLEETQGRIRFSRNDGVKGLIQQLQNCQTDEQAGVFTTALIQLINRGRVNVNFNAFLTHMYTAWDRVRVAIPNELQDQARQGQSTHRREVHASVAASVRNLREKYKNQLPEDDIFELVQIMLMSVFPDNMEALLNDAVRVAKVLVGDLEIERLLAISPHTRAGVDDEDTALNVAARTLWKDKSTEIQTAIQNVVRLYSQQHDLRDSTQLLSALKDNSRFEDGISQVGYEELLRLIYAAITDESWGENKDIPGRWRSLMARMVRAKNEYHPGNQACSAGTFNALLESLSGVHPNVLIISSFRSMMQEISAKKEPIEFVRQVEHALSYLGPDARQDHGYMQDIKDFAAALILVIKHNRKNLKDYPETERGFARQKQEVERLQAQRYHFNGQRLKGRVAKRNSRALRIALEKLDEMRRDLPCRVEKAIARQDNHIRLLKRFTSRSFHIQQIEAQ